MGKTGTLVSASLESQMLQAGIERFRTFEQRAIEHNKQSITPAGRKLCSTLVESLANAIDTFVQKSLKAAKGRKSEAALYLHTIHPQVAATFTCRNLIDRLSKSPTLTDQAYRIGRLLEEESRMEHFRNKKVGSNYEWKPWSYKTKVLVGVKLIEFFMAVSNIITIKKVRQHKKRTCTLIQATPQALSFIESYNERVEKLRPLYGPLTRPPKDWTSLHEGGFHELKLCFVKAHCKEHLKILENWPMPKVYQAVNALQRTPYCINRNVYKVACALKNKGLPLAGFPETDKINQERTTTGDEQDFLNHTLDIVLTLQCAQDYLEEEQIYFVHTLDFRGRVYPVTSYLSPQGNDLHRGLLTFASSEAKPLGNDGVCWLAIHGANCWGHSLEKKSFQERINWVEAHENRIRITAMNPHADYWWCEAESPFQFLAFCFEWAQYLKEGFSYCCSLPVSTDGSNNALQHFSALLRDEDLGASTNLIPSDVPQDIYQEICKQVNELIAMDKQNGVKEAQQWQGHVTRKDVKRPVMTHCYGSKEFGVQRMIIEDSLKPWRNSSKPWPFKDNGRSAARYLAKTIKKAMIQRIKSAETCMGYLKTIATLFGKRNLPLRWITPANFPVLQYYRKQNIQRIKTHLYGIMQRLNIATEGCAIDLKAQRDGISANFIHSLDGAAMMLTIEHALANGITVFRMIHDSYGVVPADMPLLNQCLREVFVAIYEGDILRHFIEDVVSILEKDETISLPSRPKQGNLDLKMVLKSPYFFA